MLGFLKWALGKTRVYGLNHAVLNMKLPPESMWMNMGYWKNTGDFPEACQALLDQVLETGLATERSPSVRILDVGCGCGDQSAYIASLTYGALDKTPNIALTASGSGFNSSDGGSDPALRHIIGKESLKPLVNTYIGITLEPSQAQIARQRIRLQQKRNNGQGSCSSADVFCADGAKPSSWTGELQNSISNIVGTTHDPDTSTWLLALDTMYHFRPSRLPILHYARNTLHASFMAYDLLLADNTSWWQRLRMRLVCWITGSPFGNFLTREEYVRLLVAAGYEASQIEIKDVSRHVFAGISEFLGQRLQDGQPYGLNVGKFRGAKLLFGWWARSGVVRGVVVVARRS
ncbi:uncharacterized protein N7482_002239 [Penicillium canariense]|uniref:S-adenosyl-L-methionine-dependent methyltransferase n=1 Tax=Penicillium canariense TaxID=189055 RepID=A0A9W9IH76_9EURO|nr:uncharacterized protein N7482_002239 [Penicillium canariense]KAJ5176362.1 hypothetical protein N7482_002239 [Penicillium canariense]